MTDTETSPLLQGHRESHRRWWVHEGLDRDTYDVFVVQYTIVNGEVQGQHYLTLGESGTANQWLPYEEFDRIEPCLRIPGFLVHLISEEMVPETKRDEMTARLSDLFVALFTKLLAASDPGPHPEEPDGRTEG